MTIGSFEINGSGLNPLDPTVVRTITEKLLTDEEQHVHHFRALQDHLELKLSELKLAVRHFLRRRPISGSTSVQEIIFT